MDETSEPTEPMSSEERIRRARGGLTAREDAAALPEDPGHRTEPIPPAEPPELAPAEFRPHMPGEHEAPAGAPRGRYRPATTGAAVVKALLALWVVFAAVSAASSLVESRIASRLIESGLSVSLADIDASDTRQQLIAIAWLVAQIGTGVAFIAWLLRLCDNLEPLGSPAPRHGRGWAIGGWFVPILNLWRPKQIIDDVWRASRPEGRREALGSASVPGVLNLWWALWVARIGLDRVVAAAGRAGDLENLRTAARFDVALGVVTMATAVAAIVVVDALTLRQDDRARVNVALGVELPTAPSRTAPPALGVPAVGAAFIGIATFLAFDPPVLPTSL